MNFSSFFIQKIYRIGFLLLLILVVFDLLAFFHLPNTLFSEIFSATREQTPLTWLSATSFLFLGLACLSIYYRLREKIWYFLAVIFLFFSMDDATYLHERLSGALQENSNVLLTFPSYVWALLYSPLLAFSFCALLYLLWKKTISESRKPVIIGLILLSGAFLLDLIDGVTQKNPSIVFCLEQTCHLTTLHLMRLLEEVLEVLAVGVIGYTLIREHLLLPESLTHTPEESTL